MAECKCELKFFSAPSNGGFFQKSSKGEKCTSARPLFSQRQNSGMTKLDQSLLYVEILDHVRLRDFTMLEISRATLSEMAPPSYAETLTAAQSVLSVRLIGLTCHWYVCVPSNAASVSVLHGLRCCECLRAVPFDLILIPNQAVRTANDPHKQTLNSPHARVVNSDLDLRAEREAEAFLNSSS